MSGLFGLFHPQLSPSTGARHRPVPRLSLAADPGTIYAIGDVHGCLSLLVELEERIFADAEGLSGEKLIVMLGDYVDRGPKSAQVLDHLLANPGRPEFVRCCLAGNHEIAMLGFLDDPRRNAAWLGFGGAEALDSYGITPETLERLKPTDRRLRQVLDAHVPEDHRSFLASLPLLIETPSYIFSHGGLRQGVGLGRQTEYDVAWTRHDLSIDYIEFGKIVVHGHTPVEAPLIKPYRLAIDTGAYLTGKLTAIRLQHDMAPNLITAGSTRRIGAPT